MLFRALFAGLLVTVLCGCGSGSSALLREPGTYAYPGDGTITSNAAERIFKSDYINIQSAQNPQDRFQKIIVFVDTPRIADLSKNDVGYSEEQLRDMVSEAARDAVSSFGRFERTSNRAAAEIVLTATLYHADAWADTKMSKSEAETLWGKAGAVVEGSALSKINREAIDVNCGIVLSRVSNGNEFAFRRVLGRLVANQGQAVESGSFIVGNNAGTGKSFVSVQNAKLKSTGLVRAIRTGIEGAIAEVLVSVDRELWAPVNKDGLRPKTVGPTFATGSSSEQ